MVTAITVLIVAAGYAASLLMPVRYSASARIFLDQGWLQSVAGSMDPARVVRTQAELALSTGTVAAITQQTHLNSVTVTSRLTSVASADGNYFTLAATGPTPAAAAQLVQAAEEGYQSVIASQQRTAATQALAEIDAARKSMQRQLQDVNNRLGAQPDDPSLLARQTQLQDGLASLAKRTTDALVSSSITSSPVQLAESPRLPSAPSYPTPKRNGLIAAIFGVIAGCAAAWWRETARLTHADASPERSAVLRDDMRPVLRASRR